MQKETLQIFRSKLRNEVFFLFQLHNPSQRRLFLTAVLIIRKSS